MKFFEPKFRQSTETFDTNTWYVYKDFGNGHLELITSVTDRVDAQILTNRAHHEQLIKAIKSIDNSAIVSESFLDSVLADKVHPISAIEHFFSDNPIDIDIFTPLKGRVSDFHTEVNKLNRPYVSISKDTWDILINKKSDYYLTPSGKVVTFGNTSCHGSDTGYALMPLNDEESQKILTKNKL